MKTRRILLPTDFSKNARQAIDYAIALFENEPCVFYILNAFHVSPSGLSSTINKAKDTRLYRAIKEESKRSSKSLLDELNTQNNNSKHKFESLSLSNLLLNAIKKVVLEKNIDYVFMGTKGSSAVKEVFMGSSTVNILKHFDLCPLVAIPENFKFRIPEEIAFATNFEHIYSETELIPLVQMAKLWNSTVAIVHVDTGKALNVQQENSKELLKSRLQEIPFRFEEVNGESKIANALAKYATNNKQTGMVAMINYWHSFFEKLTKEEVVKKVTFKTEIPFLILPLVE